VPEASAAHRRAEVNLDDTQQAAKSVAINSAGEAWAPSSRQPQESRMITSAI
jgi:hypothetical protein